MHHDGFRIPDKVFAVLAGLVIVLTWVALIIYYPLLPNQIPSHFGWGGSPDAFMGKLSWAVFFPGLLQIGSTSLFAFFYRRPQIASIPGGAMMELLPERFRTMMIKLIRHVLVMDIVLLNLVFAYVALLVLTSGLGLYSAINSWILLGLVLFLLLVNLVYSVWMHRLSKAAVHEVKTGRRV